MLPHASPEDRRGQSISSSTPMWTQSICSIPVSVPSTAGLPRGSRRLRAGGGCPGGWGPTCKAQALCWGRLWWLGHAAPPGAHLVLPSHALHVQHLVTPVLPQDPGLLLCQVAQLLGAALQVVVQAAQALPAPDGGFLPVHTERGGVGAPLRSLFPLLLLPRTPLVLQEIPRDLGETLCSYLMGLPFPLPPSQTG